MRITKSSLLAQCLVLMLQWTCMWTQGTATNLAATAQTLNHLGYVLGPNYKLFVAAYWRYLLASCEIFQEKITNDMARGIVAKYCPILEKCPQLSQSQSCIVQISAVSVRIACCPDLSWETPTVATEAPRSRITSIFDKEAQRTCNVLPSARIYGGTQAKRGEFPWIAMLLGNGKFLCSCVILDTTHVLTAAHCFDMQMEFPTYQVTAGKYLYNFTVVEDSEQTVNVTSLIKHEDYDPISSRNDLAVLELAKPLEWSDYVMPACLPSANDTLEPSCTVAGWGKTDGNQNASVLMKVSLQTYNKSQCYATFKDTAARTVSLYLRDGVICAANGLLGVKDACKGDSGSSLMCIKQTPQSVGYFVFGLVSNGNGCALPGEPGLYVDIPYYLSWIQKAIQSF